MSLSEAFPLPESLENSLRAARSLVVLTGAGMSAESGVPVFRGSGGLWEGFRPEELATPEAFAGSPRRVWEWYRWRLERVEAAVLHHGHRALAALEAAAGFERFDLVTQNVDGLHQRAGSERVTELHGNLTRARCSADCGRTRPARGVDPADLSCPCGKGLWRPAVVWFGEGLPEAALVESARALERAEMAWVVGTSSVVYPAAALPRMAAARGVTVVEINPEATPLSGSLEYSFRTTAAEGVATLAAAWSRLRGIPLRGGDELT
jgi:NAD-dependent deacetylase